MTGKIARIGAGSKSFSTKTIHDLVLDRELQGMIELELVLVDVREDHLMATLEYARHCARAEEMLDYMLEIQSEYLPEFRGVECQ